jgi:hypothetical protein
MKTVYYADGTRVEFQASLRKEFIKEFQDVREGQKFVDLADGTTFMKMRLGGSWNAIAVTGSRRFQNGTIFMLDAPVLLIEGA